MGANPQVANIVADNVEQRLYEGISTQQILRLIFRFMSKYKPAVKHLYDLRKGVSLMAPKPEFELFVQTLLSNSGFVVESNRILIGKCGEHEVDAIARKDGITYFVEVKHHYNYHALTGLDESRIAQAIIEDVSDGYELGTTDLKIDRAMIVTNTKYSGHAIQYGSCKNILQIGWSSPDGLCIKDLVREGRLYPLSCLRGLQGETRIKLVNKGFVLIKQLLDIDGSELVRETGIPKELALDVIEKAKLSANTLW